MNILTPLEEQPRFPGEDLSAYNAQYLGLILSNAQSLTVGHQSAEYLYPIFSGTHQPLCRAASNILSDSSRVDDVDFGIKAFEAITAFVQAKRPVPALQIMRRNIQTIINPDNSNEVSEYFDQSYLTFVTSMPLTTAVIRESAERYRKQVNLAVFGGAIARTFELHNIE